MLFSYKNDLQVKQKQINKYIRIYKHISWHLLSMLK